MLVIMPGTSFLITLQLNDKFHYVAQSGIRGFAVLLGRSDSTWIFILLFWHAIFLTNFILSIINIPLSMPQRFYVFYAASCKVKQMSYRTTKFSELILILLISKELAMAQLVEALSYKPKGRGFDSRWYHWNFY